MILYFWLLLIICIITWDLFNHFHHNAFKITQPYIYIYIYGSVLVNEMPKSARYHIDRANSIVFTSKRLPLQPVSSERNHIYIYIYITLLHLGVVEHSVRRASGCSFAILQSPRPLWSFEHSGPMTLCACVDA